MTGRITDSRLWVVRRLGALWSRLLGVVAVVAAPPVRLAFLCAIRRADKIQVGPIEVIDFTEGNTDAHLSKVREAVSLVNRWDPLRLNRIAASYDKIVIADHSQESEAVYQRFARSVLVRASALEALDPQSVAAMLVHESTHGRLDAAGVRLSARNRDRIERLCLRSEIWFLRKVPGSDALLLVKQERHEQGPY